ncbi:Uncharacterised protein [Lederbergia lenta]|uniref:Uncharacterized protein n=1 Tax=Lederbergia lenta TaxID=1467 RepID=A0A2X4WI70_LEDLE|nr:Uncharacterised protein [Lederbergia lenta]
MKSLERELALIIFKTFIELGLRSQDNLPDLIIYEAFPNDVAGDPIFKHMRMFRALYSRFYLPYLKLCFPM